MDVIFDWNLGNMIYNGLITLQLYGFPFAEIRSLQFARTHSIPLCAMKDPVLINSPGGSMQASYRCLPTSLSLRGVEFKVSPIVLRTSSIDVILGMD